jgi:hypothetical protein
VIVVVGRAVAGTDFDRAYEAGQDAFNLAHYHEAELEFSRARDLMPRLPGPWRWLGRTLRVLEKWDACVAASTQAVRLRPGSPLVPEVKKDIDSCRAALGRPAYDRRLPAGQGALAVVTDVVGAPIVVDGIAKGATPLAPMPLLAGRHLVRMMGSAAEPEVLEATVEVIPGIVVDALFAPK